MVIDIGAHIGIFLIYISKKVKKIFAYEPVPENFSILEQNIKLNRLDNKTKIFNLAVSDSNADSKIYFSQINTAGHSIYEKNDKYVTIKSITLKNIFDNNNIESCDLLKIDTEGSEYRILLNLPKAYFDRIKKIHLEHHKFDTGNPNYNCEFLSKFLKAKGFNVVIKDHILLAHK